MTVVVLIVCMAARGQGNDEHLKETALKKVFSYAKGMSEDSIYKTDAYVKYKLNTEKRNFMLAVIPTMYYISKGNRQYIGEVYNSMELSARGMKRAKVKVNVGTIPGNKSVMDINNMFLLPRPYSVKLIENNLISPFCRQNRKLYKYCVTPLTGNRLEITFMPRQLNTQLVSGKAVVDDADGRIISIQFEGEYDMIRFSIQSVMGDEGLASLYPKECYIKSTFQFLGNIISSEYAAIGLKPNHYADTLKNSHSMEVMEKLRPIPLTDDEVMLYKAMKSAKKDIKIEKDKGTDEENKRKALSWNQIGDAMVSRMKGSFGQNQQGRYRISPILNPLYLGYSKSKGVTYKTKVSLGYAFDNNWMISLDARAGYSFKQNQLYYKLPLRLYFNKRHNGYVEAALANGNRITNSQVLDKIIGEKGDTINWEALDLDYFNDQNVKVYANYDLNKYVNVQLGAVFHRRTAVKKANFEITDMPATYHSFAPTLQLKLYPWGKPNAVMRFDYERGIKGVANSTMEYECFELDCSWLHNINGLRALSLQMGGGLYTSRSQDAYFLDYNNFKDENIPGGWNDEWTGRFMLLGSNWYNASKYYVRANATYESPFMLMSHLPWIGKYVEMERIYANALLVERLNPYMEYGYGFKNRLFSAGMFVATRNDKFDGFGFRFEIELFRNW